MNLNGSPPSQPGIPRRLTSLLLERARSLTAKDVRIGLGYTAVRLSDGGTGVALTFLTEAGDGCSVFTGLRPLAGRPASDLLELLGSPDMLESAVGLACANALANRDVAESRFQHGDMLEALDLQSQDRVAMVGHFHPMVGPIRQRVKELIVFERIPAPRGELRPVDEALDVIPDCDVALITGTAIINNTIDGLLESASGCRAVVVAGASTPLAPQLFEGTPVTMLSGVTVADPDGLLQVVSEGGGMRLFKPFVRKVNLVISRPTG